MEEEVPTLARDQGQRITNQLLARYGVPAFIRRAKRVDEALDELLARCQQIRERWLLLVRIQLETLRLLAGGDWAALRPYLADEQQVGVLEALHAQLQPRLRGPVEPSASPKKLRRALRALIEQLERFNQRWQAHWPTVDLSAVNEARDHYNRWYVLEKECALRSPRLARIGFEPLPPLTGEELAALLPPLPVPRAS